MTADTVPWRKPTITSEPEPKESEEIPKTVPWRGETIEGESREIARPALSVDVMFAIDCTGSMSGEIEGVKSAVIEFAKIIHDDGISMRLGLIEYRDRTIGEEPIVHMFGEEVFTSDIPSYKEEVAGLAASGGGPRPESTFDAILLSLKQPRDSGGAYAIVAITDAPPRVPDKECKSADGLLTEIVESKLDQLYILFPLSDASCSVYHDILSTMTGEAFDLRGSKESFYDTLISLSRTISTNTRII